MAVVGITPKLVERLLAAYPDAIAGMKDSSGDWNNTKTFLDAFSKSGFDVFVGSESFLLANMRNGGVGTISVFSRRSFALSVSLGGCLARSRRTNDR